MPSRSPPLAGSATQTSSHRKKVRTLSNAAEVLREIGTNVWRARVVGFLAGTAGTVYAIRRRNRPTSALRTFALAFFGGFAGSMLFIPIGIGMSRSAMRSIENPQHLAGVLKQKMEERRQGGPLGSSPPFDASSENAGDGTGPWTNTPRTDWGDAQGAPARGPWAATGDGATRGPWASMGSGPARGSWSDKPQDAPSRGPWTPGPPIARAPPAASQDWSTTESLDSAEPAQEAPAGTGPGTRWAQLRQDRTGQPSTWEDIRQRSAKEAMAQQSQQQASRAPPAEPRISDYDRAVEEYNKAMERERQGLDVTTGFADDTQIR